MKTFKVFLITAAIVISIGGAFAFRPKQDGCLYVTNYRQVAGGYQQVGVLGVDYICWDYPGTCTYYKPNPGEEIYLPCRPGVYEVIPHGLKKK